MASYYSIERLTPEQEEDFERRGTPSRNYGRLSREKIQILAGTPMTFKKSNFAKKRRTGGNATVEDHEIDMVKLLDRPRPWRLTRFLKEISARENVKIGEVTHEDYTIRVVDGGIAEALGKGDNLDDDEDMEGVDIEQRGNLALLRPYDASGSTDIWWSKFELWREIISNAFVNMLPDRPFSCYVYAKDAVGDDVPVYYVELEVGTEVDRHVMVWELDQVLTSVQPDARPHEASRASEYASAYQKVYFFLNWDQEEFRRVEKITIADLPRRGVSKWLTYFDVLTKMRPFDALISIVVIIVTTYVSILIENYAISLVAGIIVAGIAAEEWLPPQTILFGAIARFYANESLALHMYYAANLDLSTRRVLITLLASLGEIVDFINVNSSQKFTFLGEEYAYGDALLVFASFLNVVGLYQTAIAGVYNQFSHTDFPSSTDYNPKVYTDDRGFVRQVIEDCIPVEEFSSVYRPLLHWQRGMQHRSLGTNIDWGSPGAPPSWICYFMSTPATSAIATRWIYGYSFPFHVLPFAIIEQILAILGGLMTLCFDFPVVIALSLSMLTKRYTSREFTKSANAFALSLYCPVQIFVEIVDEYNQAVAELLEINVSLARKRSTARLYRLPLCQRVRTGRSSNHSWKFGDYMYDSSYYRVSDMVLVNPRASKLGMMDKLRLFYKRHKLIWNTTDGIRYASPVLSCGDNTAARRKTYFGRGLDHEEARRLDPASKPAIYIDPVTGMWSNYKSDRNMSQVVSIHNSKFHESNDDDDDDDN